MRRWWWVFPAVAVLGVAVMLLWPGSYCRSAKARYGIEVPQCPDGNVLQSLGISGYGLRRGGVGRVRISAIAVYTVAGRDTALRETIPTIKEVSLAVVDAAGKAKALTPKLREDGPKDGWDRRPGAALAQVELPTDLPDGEFRLRATVTTRVGQGSVDLPLSIYAPARIHVLTDRPLYRAGQRIMFRALVVRALDLSPIDHRPGRWVVEDPAGEVMLEEKVPAGDWGVASGSFLLDSEAPSGTWAVSWRSGNDSGKATVEVKPFTLPRFRVRATAARSFYGPNATPLLNGSVVYSSGAPVGGAKVRLRWGSSGKKPRAADQRWPLPTHWLTGALPRRVTADAYGRFSLQLPRVPADLRGKVTLTAALSAVDPAGGRAEGRADVLLSQDAIAVSASSTFDGGLVKNFNNRLYLRVTRADGSSLAGASVAVRKAWDPAEQPIQTTLDADSVGRIQIDPGPPVNVVIPPMPARPRARRAAKLSRSLDMVTNNRTTLDDTTEIQGWLPSLNACGRWGQVNDNTATLALTVDRGGVIKGGHPDSPAARCVYNLIKKRPLTAGQPRVLVLEFAFDEPDLPRLAASIRGALGQPPRELRELVDLAAKDARICLPARLSGELPGVLSWRLNAGQKRPTWSWLERRGRQGKPLSREVAACILSRLTGVSLATPVKSTQLGVVSYSASSPSDDNKAARPKTKIMKGYELLVTAQLDGKPLGQTRLRLGPGTIPPLSLRAEPVLAKPGQAVALTLLRGPSFSGRLPRVIVAKHGGKTSKIKLAKKARTASYTVPKGARGWLTFAAGAQRALVFVRSGGQLSLKVTPDRPDYRPGQTARLSIRVRLGDKPTRASVGLFGVDSTLGQLATLPGVDAFRPFYPGLKQRSGRSGGGGKTFGVLDSQALVMGRVRGPFAAEAVVLGLEPKVPDSIHIAAELGGSAESSVDTNARLADRFFTVLAELHRLTRAWESSAPKSEQMSPKRMAGLWSGALDGCAKRGEPVEDAFGRRLRLHRLPADLLALTDPRQVVAEGTRLPEDVENWTRWVRKVKP